VIFRDRADAGRQLAAVLVRRALDAPVVLGLPRGGVAVGFEVATALDAPLDVILVRKIGVPFQPELAMGALGEGGIVVVNDTVLRAAGLSKEAFEAVRRTEEAELERRAAAYRGDRPRVALGGRVVIIVDDGVATGSTAKAACSVARAAGSARLILAVPVGPPGTAQSFAGVADEVVCLATPRNFFSIGESYLDFSPTTDAEVVALLARASGA
jgi:putative phosphoribosyl transferase